MASRIDLRRQRVSTDLIAAEGLGDHVACGLYLYLYGPPGEALADEWTSWLAARFPAVEAEAVEEVEAVEAVEG